MGAAISGSWNAAAGTTEKNAAWPTGSGKNAATPAPELRARPDRRQFGARQSREFSDRRRFPFRNQLLVPVSTASNSDQEIAGRTGGVERIAWHCSPSTRGSAVAIVQETNSSLAFRHLPGPHPSETMRHPPTSRTPPY